MNSSSNGSGAVMGILCGAGIVLILIVIANWKIFQKAGKPGWHSIIPILSTIDAYDICWNSGMGLISLALSFISSLISRNAGTMSRGTAVFVLILSAASLIINAVYLYKLAKAFGKGTGFFLGLLFLLPIFIMILGFGDAVYQPYADYYRNKTNEYRNPNSVYNDIDSEQHNPDNYNS